MSKITKFRRHVSAIGVYTAPVISVLALGFVLNTTNPLASGPVVILLVFTLLYILVVSIVSAMLHLTAAIVRMMNPTYNFPLRRSNYVVSIVALAPVLFVALNTLGQLDVLEIILIILLVVLGCFYVIRRSTK